MICAEPLTHVAYGPCGHRDACVECVARLRFVMDDERCVICQQQCPDVRYARDGRLHGDHRFGGVRGAAQARARGRELHHDEKLDIFFDDRAVCRKVEQLPRLSCVRVRARPTAGSRRSCRTTRAQGSSARTSRKHDRFFCEVCLEGRKVFVSQQVTYTRRSWTSTRRRRGGRWTRRWAVRGPPRVPFLRQALLRRRRAVSPHAVGARDVPLVPQERTRDKFVYYRDYDELERHYTTAHHPCLHPECLAKKFVVFQSPQELKNHEGLEHGRAMTKAERKEALRVHVEFSTNGGVGGSGARRRGRADARGTSRGTRGAPARRRRMTRARARERRAERRARGARARANAERAQLEAVLRASRLEDGGASMPRPPSMDEFPDLRAGGGGSSSRGGRREARRGGLGRARGARAAAARLSASGARVGGGDGRTSRRCPRASGDHGRIPQIAQTRRQPAPMPELPARAAERLAARLAGLAAGRAAVAAAAPPARGPGPRRRPPRETSRALGARAPSLRGLASGLVRVVLPPRARPRCPPRTSSRCARGGRQGRLLAPAAGPAEREREPAFRCVGGRLSVPARSTSGRKRTRTRTRRYEKAIRKRKQPPRNRLLRPRPRLSRRKSRKLPISRLGTIGSSPACGRPSTRAALRSRFSPTSPRGSRRGG